MGKNRSVAARILRVNHGGENGAICIYTAQIAIARLTARDLLPFLHEALAHERTHRSRFRDLMPLRASKPCRAMWIWVAGGGVLGVVTGLFGREAVEVTVHRHLDDQIAWADDHDPEMAAVIRSIRAEELEHIQFAVEHRQSGGYRWLERMIAAATEALIWISTRGDSLRLARQLRNGIGV